MAMGIEQLRDAIRRGHPGSRLEPLTTDRLARLAADYPTLPAHLRELFTTVGVGTIGDGRYAIHELLSPAEVYDAETAASLAGVVLVGDDFAGVCEAYRVVDGRWHFGSVNDSGEFEPGEPQHSFVDFLAEWYGTPGEG